MRLASFRIVMLGVAGFWVIDGAALAKNIELGQGHIGSWVEVGDYPDAADRLWSAAGGALEFGRALDVFAADARDVRWSPVLSATRAGVKTRVLICRGEAGSPPQGGSFPETQLPEGADVRILDACPTAGSFAVTGLDEVLMTIGPEDSRVAAPVIAIRDATMSGELRRLFERRWQDGERVEPRGAPEQPATPHDRPATRPEVTGKTLRIHERSPRQVSAQLADSESKTLALLRKASQSSRTGGTGSKSVLFVGPELVTMAGGELQATDLLRWALTEAPRGGAPLQVALDSEIDTEEFDRLVGSLGARPAVVVRRGTVHSGFVNRDRMARGFVWVGGPDLGIVVAGVAPLLVSFESSEPNSPSDEGTPRDDDGSAQPRQEEGRP